MKSILQKIEEKYEPEPNSGCWLWTGAITYGGYGVLKIGNTMTTAHRVSYELHKGKIPEGLQLDHLCRVRCCVNPDHLEPVTNKENMRRGLGNGPAVKKQLSKTHCPKSHPYSGENLYLMKNGGRKCRECHRIEARLYAKKKREINGA